jgi:hypothetical protein
MLAYSVVAGQLIGRTKEAIQNLATGRNDSNYDLFDENGELNYRRINQLFNIE